MWPPPPGGTWVIDLDGVVWLMGRPIPGADEAVARLRGAGVRVLFATNNSAPTRAELHKRLAHCGITAEDADLLSSADVAAGLLAPGLVGASCWVTTAYRGSGRPRRRPWCPRAPADAVVVGWTRSFTFDGGGPGRRGGAGAAPAWSARTTTPTYPTPEGLLPGAGVHAGGGVHRGRGARPRWRASPTGPRSRPSRPGCPPESSGPWWGTGPSTDGALAAQLGIPFALVLSGVTREGEVPPDAGAAAVAPDLATPGPPHPGRIDESAC